MALLFMDSFDHYGSIDPVTSGKISYTYGTGMFMPTTAQARTGAYSLKSTFSSPDILTPTVATAGACIVGFAFRTDTFSDNTFVAIRDAGTDQVVFSIIFGGVINVRDANGNVIGTGSITIPANSWTYFEAKIVIHDSAGTIETRINGATDLNLTGRDTKGFLSGNWTNVRIRSNSSEFYLDDLYLCDDTGAAPWNTFLGAVKVECLMPQTDAVAVGANQGLTPSTGTDHGALVDEIGPNTTDYNGSATVGAKDTYNYPNMALSGTILGVQVNPYVLKTDAGARTICSVVRTNSVDYDGAAIPPATTYSYRSQIRQINPNTGVAWTVADINAIQAGMKIVS